jgi:hypothetical protein
MVIAIISPGRAEPAATVVIAADPPDGAIVPLLRAELQALGLQVVESGTPDASVRFRVVVTPSKLEVWVSDPATGQVVLREVFTQSDGAPIESRTAVLHAVELLRWQLQGASPRSRPEPPPVLAPAPAPPPPAVVTDYRLTVLPQAQYSPGGMRMGVGAQFDVLWRRGWFGLRLVGSSLLVPHRIEAAEGRAEVVSRLGGLEAVLLHVGSAPGFGADVGMGMALSISHLRGTAADTYVAHDDDLITAAPIVDVRASYRVSQGLALVLGSSLAVPLRSDRIRFDGREVGRYGAVLATVGLGVETTIR